MKLEVLRDYMLDSASPFEERVRTLDFLVRSLKQFIESVPVQGVLIPLSGGIDSSLVAALASLACGPTFVHGITLPGPFSSTHSLTDAQELAANLQIDCMNASITQSFELCTEELKCMLGRELKGFTQENIQARLRMVFAMAVANEHNWILLNTGNLSESYMGYSTLYGDMAGAFAPLGGLFKTEVYALTHTYNQITALKSEDMYKLKNILSEDVLMRFIWYKGSGRIPQNILSKAPSAELAPGQSDEASFGLSYKLLDSYLIRRFVRGEDPERIWEDLQVLPDTASSIDARIKAAAFKRALEPFHPLVHPA